MNGQEVKDLVIPEGVTGIGAHVFRGCTGMTSVTIPTTLKSIEERAFYGNTSLTAVYIKDLTAWCKIEYGINEAFPSDAPNPLIYAKHLYMDGQEVTNLVIPEDVSAISSFAFKNCEGLTSINIGNTVTTIGEYAFANCTNVRTITIGSAVKSIEKYNFYGCKDLQTVYSLIEEPFPLSGQFQFCTPNETNDGTVFTSATLYVPVGTKSKYEVTAGWKKFKNIVEMVNIDPIEGETTVNTESLNGQDLSDNVVDDVYYNTGDGSYDATDGSIVIGETTNMGQITNAVPGSDDVKNNFTGIILKVAAGKGIIKVNVKTSGNAQLVVQVGNGTPMIASKTEQGDVVISYDVAEDTYVYIYAIIGSSASPSMRVSSTDEVRIYGFTVSPEASSVKAVWANEDGNVQIFSLDGKPLNEPQKGVNIVRMSNGQVRKVVVK